MYVSHPLHLSPLFYIVTSGCWPKGAELQEWGINRHVHHLTLRLSPWMLKWVHGIFPHQYHGKSPQWKSVWLFSQQQKAGVEGEGSVRERWMKVEKINNVCQPGARVCYIVWGVRLWGGILFRERPCRQISPSHVTKNRWQEKPWVRVETTLRKLRNALGLGRWRRSIAFSIFASPEDTGALGRGGKREDVSTR